MSHSPLREVSYQEFRQQAHYGGLRFADAGGWWRNQGQATRDVEDLCTLRHNILVALWEHMPVSAGYLSISGLFTWTRPGAVRLMEMAIKQDTDGTLDFYRCEFNTGNRLDALALATLGFLTAWDVVVVDTQLSFGVEVNNNDEMIWVAQDKGMFEKLTEFARGWDLL